MGRRKKTQDKEWRASGEAGWWSTRFQSFPHAGNLRKFSGPPRAAALSSLPRFPAGPSPAAAARAAGSAVLLGSARGLEGGDGREGGRLSAVHRPV